MGALDEKGVYVGQVQPAPGLAGTTQVLKQLADMIELLVDSALGVAPLLTKVDSEVGCGRRSIGCHGSTGMPITS